MKKFHKLVAVSLAVSVALSSAVPVLANDLGRYVPGRQAAGAIIDLPQEVEEVEEEEVIVQAWENNPLFYEFPELTITSQRIFGNSNQYRGVIPVIQGAAFNAVNTQFARNVHNAVTVTGVPVNYGGIGIGFEADQTNNRFTVITQTIGRAGMLSDVVHIVVIDRSTNQVSTIAAIEAHLQAMIEVLEEEIAELEARQGLPSDEGETLDDLELDEAEIVGEAEEAPAQDDEEDEDEDYSYAEESYDYDLLPMSLPLSLIEEFGLEIELDEDYGLVGILYEDEVVVVLELGSAVILVIYEDDFLEFELSAEIYVVNGEVYAPLDFFIDIIGLEFDEELFEYYSYALEEYDYLENDELDEDTEEEEDYNYEEE